METIKAIRNRRAEMNVPHTRKASLYIETKNEGWFCNAERYYQKLAGCDRIVLNAAPPESAVKLVCSGANLYIPFAELVDVALEIARLSKELEKAEKELARVEGKLHNKGFLDKAPAALVEAEKGKLEKYQALAASLRESIEEMKKS